MLQVVKGIQRQRRNCIHNAGFLMLFISMLLAFVASPSSVFSQDEPEYDEISVFLNVQRVGGADIEAVIQDETAYLPIVDIFNFLKIKTITSAQLDSVYGFFISQEATYLVDKINRRITFQGKQYDLKENDIIQTATNLYLKAPIFGQVFGLDCKFSFRSLSVTLTTKIELPIIREMRQEQMRTNINRLKGEIKSDTIIGRKFPVLQFGMADWSVISTQQVNGPTDTRINFALGSVIAGGEANVLLNINNNTPFSEKQQQYLWRFVNNDSPVLRQIMAGKIFTPVTASIFDPIVGFQITNTPTTYRRSFDTYTISDVTDPNWVVELYVNNVLIDYVKADASGFYKFDVPLVYGSSAVKLKFYGPWGEERIKEENISIPFNFLPPKELEYTLSAGIVEDSIRSKFSRASFNYGVSRRVTMGAGVEYLSSIKTQTTMPYVNASFRLFSGLLLSGEYTYSVRSKGLISYRFPSNLQFEINYTKYEKGQKAIIYNYLEERKAVISVPIKSKNFSAYSRLTINQIVLPNLKNTNAEMLLSGAVFGVNTNFTTYGLFTDFSKPYLYSNLSLSLRLPWRLTVTPQVQYEYNNNQLISLRANFEKPLFKRGYLNCSYEQNFRSHTKNFEFGFRYDLSFAQTGFSVRNTDNQTTFVESARGSLLYNPKTAYVGTNNRTSVGKGAITLVPFLDVNGSGHHEKGEPRAVGLLFRINGGTIIPNDRDSTINIFDLTPYTNYYLELDKNSFDNIAWQMSNLVMKVMVDANQFRTIEIPISVMGEVTGNVNMGQKGQGQMLVNVYKNDSIFVSRTMTESDGYYSYLGLKPGNYTVRIDPAQLKKLNWESTPKSIPITVSGSLDGDIIDGIDFNLKNLNKTLPVENESSSQTVTKPETDIKTTPAVKTVPEVKAVPNVKPVAIPEVKPATIPEVKPVPETRPVPVVVPVPEPKVNPVIKTEAADQPAKSAPSPSPSPQPSPQPLPSPLPSPSPLPQPSQPLHNKPAIVGFEGSVYQICATKVKSAALAEKKTLDKISGRQSVIVYEDGLYKVRIQGFAYRELAWAYASTLKKSGYTNFYIPVIEAGVPVEIGIFNNEAEAITQMKNWCKKTSKPLYITFENEQYKLRVKGFKTREDAMKFIEENEKGDQ